MINLKSVKRNYIILIILAYAPLLLSIAFSSEIVKLQAVFEYKWLLFLILLLLPILWTYILLLKNHCEELEIKISEIENSIPINNQSVQEPEKLSSRETFYILAGLTNREKELLRRFTKEDTRTISFHNKDIIADGLLKIGILECSVNQKTNEYSYSIKSLYSAYIKRRPDSIGLQHNN